jgi:TusA-related sulfurtransferase
MPRANSKARYQDPWERLEGESSKAFEAFCTYRDLGANRSIRKTAQKLGKNNTTIGEWSSKYGWVERALAWDAEKDREARQEQLDDIKKMRKTHADLAVAILVKAAKRLKALTEDEMTANNIIQFVETGSKLERLSRGEPDSITEERRRMEDVAANRVIEELCTDPGFLAAVQSAYTQTEGSGDAGSAAGPVDTGENRG